MNITIQNNSLTDYLTFSMIAAGWLVYPALPDNYKNFDIGVPSSSLATSTSSSSQSYKYEWSEIDTMPTQK
jgi:hypothetical protein